MAYNPPSPYSNSGRLPVYDGPVRYGHGGGGRMSPSSSEEYIPTYPGAAPSPAPYEPKYGPVYPAGPPQQLQQQPQQIVYGQPQYVYAAAPPPGNGGWPPQQPQPGYAMPGPPKPSYPPASYGASEAGMKIPAKGGPSDAIVLAPTIRSEEASVHGPCPISWDIRRPVNSAHLRAASDDDLNLPATYPPTRTMVIVNKHLPWAITISKYSTIRVKDVLEGIYKDLQEKITIPEYWIASTDRRKSIDSVNEREMDNPRNQKRKWGPKKKPGDRLRVDFLDQLVLFKGLYHDDKLLGERLAHNPDSIEDAWVVSLGFTTEKLT